MVCEIAAWLSLVGFGLALSVIDMREHRLPNNLVAVAALLGLAAVAASAISSGDLGSLVRAVLGAVMVF